METKSSKRPALRYHGGKWMLAPWIISLFPEHRVYVEPYGGAMSVLLRKQRSYAEIYNERDGEIVNVFEMLRDRGPELKELLRLTPFSRDEFIGAYEHSGDPLEQARRTIIKSFIGFGSDAIKNKSGFRANSHRSGTTPAHDDAVDIVSQHDSPNTLFYIDPPYVHSTRSAKNPKQYIYEMSDDDHERLSDVLHKVEGNVVLSGYDSPLYKNLYKDFKRVERPALADGARPRTEVCWMNFDSGNLFQSAHS